MLVLERRPRFALLLTLALVLVLFAGALSARPARASTVLLSGTFNFLVVDNARNRVYVSNPNGTVGVIDAGTDKVLRWIPVGSGPTSMDLTFDGSQLLVSLTNGNQIAVVDLNTDAVVRRVGLPFSPGDVAAGRPGRAYVTPWGITYSTYIIDPDTASLVGPINAASGYYEDPVARISPDRQVLYMADRQAAPTSIDAFSVATDQPVYLGGTPWGIDSVKDMYVSPDGSRLYYPNPAAYLVQDFDTSNWSSLPSLNTGPYPQSVCLSANGTIAFATAETQTTLFAFNALTGALKGTFALTGDPTIVRSLETGTQAFVITSAGLEVVATGYAAYTYPMPPPTAFAVPPGGLAPLSVSFYASATDGVPPYTFAWTFGDGTTGSGPSASHVYATPGVYTATVTLRDSGGVTAATSLAVGVAKPPPPNPLTTGPTLTGASFDPASNGWVPPDTQVAAGPGYVVEMVNTEYLVWSRDGTQAGGGYLSTLFQVPPTDFITDPRVVYDPFSLTWFASVSDLTTHSLLLATAPIDPVLAWRVTAFPSRTGCPDQPYLGTGLSVVVLSDNGFSDCTANGVFVGGEFWVINKTELLQGAAPHLWHFGPDPKIQTLFPAQMESPGGEMYLVSVGWAWTVTRRLNVSGIVGAPPGTPVFDNRSLTIRDVVQPPNADQPGTNVQVNTGDARIQDAFWRNGALWMSLGDACMPVGSAVNRSCGRILQVDPTTGTVLQDFDIGDPNGDVYYPAIAVDGAGDLVVAYSFSNGSTYPSLMAAAQLAGDAPNTVHAPLLVALGYAASLQACDATSCRFGDYSGAAPDPMDPQGVWVAGEYAGTSGWLTQVAEVGVFRQARITLSYVLKGGGTPVAPPQVELVSRGALATLTLTPSPQTFSADLGSFWVATPFLINSLTERWIVESAFAGFAVNGTTYAIVYQHQFAVTLLVTPAAGGTLSLASGWFNATASLSVTATATAGWKLDHWAGLGAGSYTGIAPTATLVVSSAIQETAVFFVGITIQAGAGGSVTYAYGNTTGTVPAGATATVYVPLGTSVTLIATPDLLDGFTGWSGDENGTGASFTRPVNAPTSVRAAFALSVVGETVIGGIAGAIVLAAVALVLLWRRRRKPAAASPAAANPTPPPASPPPTNAGPNGPPGPANPPPPPPGTL